MTIPPEIRVMFENFKEDLRYLRVNSDSVVERLTAVETKLKFMPIRDEILTENDITTRIEASIGAHLLACKAAKPSMLPGPAAMDAETRRKLTQALIAALIAVASGVGGWFAKYAAGG